MTRPYRVFQIPIPLIQDHTMSTTKPKSVLIFPIKSYSERVPGKNFTIINGRPLYQHFPMTCADAGVFDEICIDTDSEEIIKWASANGFTVRVRDPKLATNEANGNDLLRAHYRAFQAGGFDLLWQGFVTTPFIKKETVEAMHWILVGAYHIGVHSNDSIMTCSRMTGFFWGGDMGIADLRPLHHRPDVMPRSQDLAPVYMERHGLFGITRKSFEITQTRAGLRLFPYVLPPEEDQDIDYPSDLSKILGEARDCYDQTNSRRTNSAGEVLPNYKGCE